MKQIAKLAALGALLLLPACGAAEVQSGAQSVASALPSNLASAAADVAANPTTQALASGAAELATDPTAQALANQALGALGSAIPSNLRLQNDQAFVLDLSQQFAGVSNYRWVVDQVPAGAESVKGKVISENSDGKLTIQPADYAKYFPVSGTYTINLILTLQNGSSQTIPIPLQVP